jgi:thioredoxin 1
MLPFGDLDAILNPPRRESLPCLHHLISSDRVLKSMLKRHPEQFAKGTKEMKMGNIVHIQQGDWQDVESSPKPVLVDFWAEWCAPCRLLAPTFEKLAANYSNEFSFAKVNVDELPEVAVQYGIQSIPTLLLLRKGEVVQEIVGARSYQDLARVLDWHLTGTEKWQPRSVQLAN